MARAIGLPWFFLLLGLSLGLNWPYLGSGFLADDVILISAMEEDPLPFSRWRGVWSGDVEDLSWCGNPWWAEPGAIGSFFRPLPSLVFEGSLRVFGRTAFPLHLLAILLHGAIGYLLFLVLRALSSGTALPVLAGVTYVVCEDHSMTVGFLSFITDVFCVFFIALSLLCHLGWLRRRRVSALVAALLALAAALGCKETAAVGPLALVVTAFFFPHGQAASAGSGPLSRRLEVFLRDPLSWAPAMVVLALYLGLYSALGLGGMDNLSYVDPLRNPARYLSHLVVHLPVMWLATLSPVPPSLGFFSPDVFVPMAGAGLVAFALFLWALWPHRREPLVIWALALYLLALLPQLGTDAGERLLYFPYFFGAVPVALLVLQVGPLARRLLPATGSAPRWTRITGWYLLGGVIISGALFSIMTPPAYVRWARPWTTDPLTAVPHVTPATRTVVILSARDFSALIMTPTLLENEVGRELDVHILSALAGRPAVERSGESGFILRLDREGWLTNFMARAFRRREELEPGEVYPGPLFDATLLDLTDDRRDVLAVGFQMHRPLGDPGLLFLAWNGRGFVHVDLDALSLGESILLRDL